MTEALLEVDLALPRRASGKVREIFEADHRLLLVATDRISAFDVILRQGIPGRGVVLTRLSEFWFRRLEAICPHHLVTTDVDAMPEAVRSQADRLSGRTMYVDALDIVPVECVARGYLAGSGWKEYRQSGTVCGVPLPAGLVESDRLPEPIFTPTTKAHEGHDEPLVYAQVEELVGVHTAARLRDLTLELYRTAAAYAARHGILLADTKFEFGLRNGELVLADEALTPDSSRYWDAERYEAGRPQDSFDKQIVRDWLEQSGWNKTPPPPDLPPAILEKAARRYREIAERLMGER
ncbi:MAG: phosphoribosylaminoimidazolesuccinocarboxamide synthase [Planctomycetota bacterium]|jgi:phosphoribosylaminoimidazole-succinocarboxamide synthase